MVGLCVLAVAFAFRAQGQTPDATACPNGALTVERRPIVAADVSAWLRGNGEMPRLSVSNDALCVDFTIGRTCWANLRHAVTLPSNAVALVWQEKTLKPSDGRRTMWLREADGDAWFAELPSGRDQIGVWREVIADLGRFSFHKDGNGRREMETVNRLDMGFNNGDQRVLIRDLQVVVCHKRTEAARTCAATRIALDPTARIAVLECAPEAAHVRRVLNAAGLRARRVTPCELAVPARFSKANCDLLVIPCSPFFPVRAVPNFRRFLKDGGAFFAFGGYAFDQLSRAPQVLPDDRFCVLATAADMNAGRTFGRALNSRVGRHGDTITSQTMSLPSLIRRIRSRTRRGSSLRPSRRCAPSARRFPSRPTCRRILPPSR